MNPFNKLTKKEEREVLNLLNKSWTDIDYEYKGLTDTEKSCISEKTFNKIVKILFNL